MTHEPDHSSPSIAAPLSGIVEPPGQTSLFAAGDQIGISMRFPIGDCRVPNYERGKVGAIEQVIELPAVNIEEDGYGRNAGSARFNYRVGIRLTWLWPAYAGAPLDELRIEIFET